ncbi:MAG: mechanosensitive ion channel [Rhodobacteraceae bacterium]|nr:mechanosensitive ion channel [Paracoccaceae bacterium]
MEPQFDPGIFDQLDIFIRQIRNFGITLLQPWRLYQIAILIGCLGFGQIMSLLLTQRMNDWMRRLEGWPKWRLRLLLLINQRIRPIFFVLAAWLMVLLISQLTNFPSRRYLISLVAELATAWLVVSIGTRMLKNRSFRRMLRWAAWIFVTLSILGFTEDAAALLDSLAVDFGTVRVSLLMILKAVVALIALFAGARILTKAAARRIEQIDDISPSMKVLSIKGLQLVVYSLALIIGLQSIGFDMTSLTVLSGAIGLGIGFGLQKVVSNLVSGVILLLDKSIKPGDVISLDDTFGWISSLGARYVSVLTRNGTEFLIPNEDLITNRVINWSHSSDLVRLDIHFGVSYDSDPHEVKRIGSVAPLKVGRVISTPAPVCHMIGFGESSIDFVLRFWIRDPTKGLTNVRGDVFLAIWDALAEAKIEIPFPRRDVHIFKTSQPHPLPHEAETPPPQTDL